MKRRMLRKALFLSRRLYDYLRRIEVGCPGCGKPITLEERFCSDCSLDNFIDYF